MGPLFGGALGAVVYQAAFKSEVNAFLWPVLIITVVLMVLAILEDKKK